MVHAWCIWSINQLDQRTPMGWLVNGLPRIITHAGVLQGGAINLNHALTVSGGKPRRLVLVLRCRVTDIIAQLRKHRTERLQSVRFCALKFDFDHAARRPQIGAQT